MTLASRRALLSGLAAAPLVPASAMPGLLAEEHPDATLIAACETAIRLFEHAKALSARLDEIEKFVPTVDPPEALFRRRTDFQCFWGFTGEPRGDGRYWYGDPQSLYYLRTERFTRAVLDGATEDPVTGIVTPRAEVDQRARGRADEIVAAEVEWRKAQREAERAAGYTDLETEVGDAFEAAWDALPDAKITPASTFAGITAKTRLAIIAFDAPERWDEDGVPLIATHIFNDILGVPA